jgi:hypothetical protein
VRCDRTVLRSVNRSFTIQPIVHHAERMAAPDCAKFRPRARQIIGRLVALAFA